MSVKVRGSKGTNISVTPDLQKEASIVIRRSTDQDLFLRNLADVSNTVLQDGYILIYNSNTNAFEGESGASIIGSAVQGLVSNVRSGNGIVVTDYELFEGTKRPIVNLANSGVVPGVYGNTSPTILIPIANVDQYGRIIGITTQGISNAEVRVANLIVTGTIVAEGNSVTAATGNFTNNLITSVFVTNGAFASNVTTNTIQGFDAYFQNLYSTSTTLSGHISANTANFSSNVIAGNIQTSRVEASSGTFTNNVTTGVVSATSILSGNVNSNNLSTFTAYANILQGGTATFTSNVSTGNLLTSRIQASSGTFSDNVISTVVSTQSLLASNVVSNTLFANTSTFSSNVIAGNLQTGRVQGTSAYFSDNVVTGNVSALNLYSLKLDTKNVSTTAVFTNSLSSNALTTNEVTSAVGTFTGNVSTGNIFTNRLDATSGNFSSNLSSFALHTGPIYATTGLYSGNVSTGNIFTNRLDATSGNFSSNLSSFGIHTGPVYATTGLYSGNVTTGNISTNRIEAVSGSFTGNLTSSRLSTGPIYATTGDFSGNVTTGNISTNRIQAVSGSFSGNATIGNLYSENFVTPNLWAYTGNFVQNLLATTITTTGHIYTPNVHAGNISTNYVYGVGANFVQNVSAGNLNVSQTVTTNDLRVLGSLFSNDITADYVVVQGNLIVQGTTTTINTEEIALADNKIVLNSNHVGTPVEDAAVVINRGNQANVEILWDETYNVWKFTNDGNVYYLIPTSTSDLAEGANLYYTNSRVHASLSVNDVGGDGALFYNTSNGQFTYRGPSPEEVRAHLSVSDLGGDGSFSYNNATGVFSYTGPSNAEVRAHLSALDLGGDGSFSYDNTTGVFSYTGPSANEVRAHLGALDLGGDGSFSYDNTTGVFSYTGPSNAEVRAHLSAADLGGDGSFSYDNTTGVFSYTGPSASEVRAHLSAGIGLNYDNTSGQFRLANTTVTAGTYGNSILIPIFTVDDQGRISNVQTTLVAGVSNFNANGNVFTIFTTSGQTFSASIQPNSVALGRDTYGDYVSNLTAGTGVTILDNIGEGSNVTVRIGQNVDPTATVTFSNVSAHTFSGNLQGDVYGTVSSLANHTTSNLAEGYNLYFTNTRAVAALQNTDATFNNVTVQGTFFSNDITADNVVIQGNLLVQGTTTSIKTVDLYVDDNKVTLNANVTGAPVLDAGLVINRGSNTNVELQWNESIDRWQFTNDGTTYYLIPTTTSDLIEGANLYFTVQRSRDSISSGVGLNYDNTTGIVRLANTTVVANTYGNSILIPIITVDDQGRIANISTTLVAGVSNFSANGNVFSIDTTSGQTFNASIQPNSIVLGRDSVGDYVSNLTAGTGVTILNNTGEGSNVTVRIGQNVDPTATVTFSNVSAHTFDGNIVADFGNITNLVGATINLTGDITANSFFTNVIQTSVITSNNIFANSITLTEYVSAANATFSSNLGTGNLFVAGNTNIKDLWVYGEAHFYGNITTYAANDLSISDNMIFINQGNQNTNPDIGFAFNYNDGIYRHGGFFRDASDGIFKVFDQYEPEPQASQFIDTANATFHLANLQATTFFGNLVGKVFGTVSSLENHTTSNVVEGANLYYTNARVQSYLENVGNIYPSGNNIQDLGRPTNRFKDLYLSGNSIYLGTVVLSSSEDGTFTVTTPSFTSNIVTENDLTTANVAELGNLYYTDARVYSNVLQLNYITNSALVGYSTNAQIALKANTADLNTSNIVEGANLYFTTARARDSISVSGAGIYDNTTGVITIIGGVSSVGGSTGNITNAQLASFIVNSGLLTTSNVSEGANLYYTDSRVYSNVIALNYITNAALVGYATNAEIALKANVTDLNTSNVVEGANLYYTDARVYSNVTALNYITNAALIGYSTNAQIALKANIADLNTSNVAEGANLYFTVNRARDSISVSGAGLYDNTTGVITIIGGVSSVGGSSGNISNAQLAASIVDSGLLTTSNVVEGANLYFTTARAITALQNTDPIFNNVTVQGSLFSNDITADNVVIQGNLLVQGTTTSIKTVELLVDDNKVTLNANVIGAPVLDAGLVVNRGSNSNVELLWNEGIDRWQFTNNGTNYYLLPISTSDLAEGANLYFTAQRSRDSISSGVGLNYDNTSGVVRLANTTVVANVYGNATTIPIITVDDQGRITNVNTAFVAGVSSFTTNANTITIVTSAGSSFQANLDPDLIVSATPPVPAYQGLTWVDSNTGKRFEYFGDGDSFQWVELISDGVIPIIGGGGGNVISVNGFVGAVYLTSANISENINLYYTNARVQSYLENVGNIIPSGNNIQNLGSPTKRFKDLYISGNSIYLGSVVLSSSDNGKFRVTSPTSTSNIVNEYDLTTANVAEVGNLYFTNERVYSNVTQLGYITASSLSGYSTNADTVSKANISDLTTANVSEVTNLYFTNSRVYSNVISIGYASNTYVNAGFNTKANVFDLTTANVSEVTNLYYTNARVYSNVISIGYAQNTYVNDRFLTKANITDLNTSNVNEGSNLYFSNSRSRLALSGGTGVIYDQSTGIISIGQSVGTSNDVVFANVTVTGNLLVQGNAVQFSANNLVVSDPLIQMGSNPVGDTFDLGFFAHYIGGSPSIERHAGLFRDATDGQFKLFTNLDPEPTTTVDTANSTYQSANLVVDFVVGKVTDISNHNTSNLAEGSNLYFTNARAILASIPAVSQINVTTPGLYYAMDSYSGNNPDIYVSAGETISFNLNAGGHPFYIRQTAGGSNYDTGLTHADNNGVISTGSSAQGQTTGDLFWKIPYELSGNTYVYQCGIHSNMVGNIVIQKAQSTLSTSDISEGSNLYFSNARVYQNVIALNYITNANLNTSNVIEGANLYYTDARVYSNVISLGYASNTYVDTSLALKANVNSAELITPNIGTPTYANLINAVSINANSISTGFLDSARLGTTANVQFRSLGIGTAPSGTLGEIRATNDITAFYSSDKKYKENVKPIQNALEIIKHIGGKTFDWTDEYINSHGGEDGYFVRKNDYGVIAQDVEKIFPLAVRKREDGSLAVDYSRLSALAFAAIVELIEEINKLKNK